MSIRPTALLRLVATVIALFSASTSHGAGQSLHGDRVLIVVVDGLRPDYITPDLMPRLDGLAESGVRGLRHHAVFPTVTRVNGPAIFTGTAPGRHGLLGNSVYLPEVDPRRVLDASSAFDLQEVHASTGGQLLTVPSLGELLEARGLTFFAASSGSAGSGMLMNHTGAGAGLVHHSLTIPDTLGPVVRRLLGPVPGAPGDGAQTALAARAIDAVLEIGIDRADADVLAVWLTEPDNTAHAFGIGAPETEEVLRAVDAEIGRLVDGLEARGLLARTNVLLTSDHGFSTRVGGASITDLVVGAGLKESDDSRDVVVAGGAIHVNEGGSARVEAIARVLQASPDIGPVFSRSSAPGSTAGVVPGTVSFDAIGWEHERSADLLAAAAWSDDENAHGWAGVVHAGGVGGHGSASDFDLRASFVAFGPDIGRGVVSDVPTGNIDIAPTTLALLGARPADTDGRVLSEIFAGGPLPETVHSEMAHVTAAAMVDGTRYDLTVRRQRVGETVYIEGTTVLRSEAARSLDEVRRIGSEQARQAVAVDADHLYAIDNFAITKLDKTTGEVVDAWKGEDGGEVIHLNSGIVRDGVLYAAHSNYPDVPMVSSIEMWDVDAMEHIGSRSFGVFQGSATWVDRHDGSWWVGFANYEGRGGQPGRGPSWTTIVRFDDEWRPIGGYVFPPVIVERFLDRSNSGGAWGPDGKLYLTGHDWAEVYVAELPEAGSVLRLVEIVPMPGEGQGIAWDPSELDAFYAIVRDTREIVESRFRTTPSASYR